MIDISVTAAVFVLGVVATASGTAVKIWGNGTKCGSKHEKIVEDLKNYGDKIKAEALIEHADMYKEIEFLRRGREENAMAIGKFSVEITGIKETLNDIRRSQNYLIEVVTGRSVRITNHEKED